jgi:4-hydroxybenzoate polyprenyltransferase
MFLRLLRPKQFLKQSLVVFPIIALGKSLNLEAFYNTLLAVLAFIFASGFVYVINDLKDQKSDIKDITKKSRPYASGLISESYMKISGAVFFLISISITFLIQSNFLILLSIILLYCFLNYCYSSLYLKRFKIIGITIVAIGFPLRFIFGTVALSLPLSPWGFILLFQLATFMLAGKRYQTVKRKQDQKNSNHFWGGEQDFWILSLVSLGALFSSSYVGFISVEANQKIWGTGPLLFSTIPLGLGILRYLEIVTHQNMYRNADATESMVKDKLLIFLAAVFTIILAFGRYLNG